MESSSLQLIESDGIRHKIYMLRGVQVMLDEDLAKLYQTDTKRLNEQVRRNKQRFPKEFRFKLTVTELRALRSQIATSFEVKPSPWGITGNKGGRTYLPYAFTEQGVAMLSAVLKSDVAVYMSIKIINAFVEMRRTIANNAQLFARLDNVEQKQLEHKIETDKKFDQVFKALAPKNPIPQRKIFYENQVFDAHVLVSKIIKSAKKKLVLVDNYVDETVLELFTKRKSGVELTVYSKDVSKLRTLDAIKFDQQYGKLQLKKFDKAHDRFLIIDDKFVYHFGASLKDLGTKWFAVSRFDTDALDFLGKLV